MGPLTLALILTTQAVAAASTIPPSNIEECRTCETTQCEEKESKCYLQCSYTCPVGYSQGENTTSTCNITDTDSSIKTTAMPTTIALVTSRVNYTTQSSLSKTIVDCWKCRVANCSRCPANDFINSCTECFFNMTVETKSSVARCVPIQPSGGGGDKNTGGQKNTNDGGSSNNAGAIAGGVVGGGILLLALTAAVVYFLWRRNKSNGGNAMMLSMMKQKKHKKAQDSDDDERSESRYTKSPVGTMRDPPSVGHEISEVDKLPEAPGIPQTSGNNEVYDAVKRQDSVAHVYKPMEFKTNTYQNSSAIDKAGDNNESIYNNTNTAPATATTVHHDEDEGPTETYENLGQDVPEDQGYYMDMSGGRAADAARTNQQEQDVAEETNEGFVQEDIYINDVDNQPPSRHAPAPPVTEDDVYLNDAPAPPLTQDDVYLNEEAVTAHPGQVDAQDELYLNQGELVEENIYQNT